MAPKAKKEEPPAKKAKTEEAKKEEEPKKEEPKKEEEPKFEEPDAPKDSRPALKEKVTFPTDQMTLNVVPTLGGQLLTSVSDGAMAYLFAAAKANVGVKSGRYMFEVKVIQGGQQGGGWDKKYGPLLKVGFSTASSSLFLGEDVDSVGYNSFGEFIADKKFVKIGPKAQFSKEKTIAVVLNLDSKSPNANTLALYLNGEKVADPKPLPENMKGQALFPTVTFRGMSIQVNFGPSTLKELPFKCRMIGGAANSDVTVTASKEPKDGKYEVVMPVALPDEGTFAFADSFLEKNPTFVELSDRKIAEWCKKSGIWGKFRWKNSSNDKPQYDYGLPGLDDFSVRKVISALAPCLPRNYLVMEVKDNLLETGRKEILKKFSYPCYKKVAQVVMGKPSKEFKELVQSKILKDKQAKSDKAWKAKKDEATRKKAAEKRKKEIEAQKKAKEDEKKAKEAEKKAKEAEEKKEGETKDEEMKEEKKEEEVKEAEPEEKVEEEEEETEPPVVELTEEEKEVDFLKRETPDLSPSIMSSSFSKFTAPKKEEGFDDIRYEWDKGAKAEEYLQAWVAKKKLVTRVDDLKPGQFFKDKSAEFDKAFAGWQAKCKTAKKPAKKDGDEDEKDVFSISDINDVGDGVPLYSAFTFEDWELTKLRFELALVLTSFKKDCGDSDRVGIPLDHVSFYYSRYFRKGLNPKPYGLATESDIYGLVKDTVVAKDSLLTLQLSDDVESFDIFIKLTEESRRERQRRIDAGDETARLKFTAPVEKKAVEKPAPKAAEKPAPKAEAGEKAGGKAAAANKMTPAPKLGESKGKGENKGKGKKGKW